MSNKIFTRVSEQDPEHDSPVPGNVKIKDNDSLEEHVRKLRRQEEIKNGEVAVVIDYHEKGQQLWVDIVDDRFTYGQGVLLEVWQGELRAIVWADPESEDPTHTIPIMPLSSASESFQKEYADAISDKEEARSI